MDHADHVLWVVHGTLTFGGRIPMSLATFPCDPQLIDPKTLAGSPTARDIQTCRQLSLDVVSMHDGETDLSLRCRAPLIKWKTKP